MYVVLELPVEITVGLETAVLIQIGCFLFLSSAEQDVRGLHLLLTSYEAFEKLFTVPLAPPPGSNVNIQGEQTHYLTATINLR